MSSISHQLPRDTRITSTGFRQVRIEISMTLTTVEHAKALKEAIDVALIPILEMADDVTEPTEIGAGSMMNAAA